MVFKEHLVTVDGNDAAAYVAYATNEVIIIYPITPSTTMAELSDEWSMQAKENLWGDTPRVVEMQSEGGVAGAIHGSLTTGSLSTTFTSSQGLLLMIPNMYKIAGELTPTVFHVATRSLAVGALSMYCDHADIMACRATGFAFLAANSVQEAQDMALIAQVATLESRVSFVHFFDGFRTSHETQKISRFGFDLIKEMINEEHINDARLRALNPEHPVLRGTAQNPDIYFSSREKVNQFYAKTPAIVEKAFDRFASLTGRSYQLFEYVGAEDAEDILIAMGSGVEPIAETVAYLNQQGQKLGLIKVRLYRPFSEEHLLKALPLSVKRIAVLDRTKEPGAAGEPLYQDIITGLNNLKNKNLYHENPLIIGGRYGLGSFEFTPTMVKAVFEHLQSDNPFHGFIVGPHDDESHLSVSYDPNFTIDDDTFQGLFYGLSSDGTVGANKNSIKIIGEATDFYCQGYYSYEAKKAGAITISHLRFGKTPIAKPYLITHSNFLACHKFSFLENVEMLKNLRPGGIFLLASSFNKDEVWAQMPVPVQQEIIDKKIQFYVINAFDIAQKCGMGGRINIIMQTAFFQISEVIPSEEAIHLIKKAIEKTYGRKGSTIVNQNIKTIDLSLASIEKVDYPEHTVGDIKMRQYIGDEVQNSFIKEVTGELLAGRGDAIPISKIPVDGSWPLSTTQYEKRNIAEQIPVWNADTCIACGKCSLICPHAAIRIKAYDKKAVGSDLPKSFKHKSINKGPLGGKEFTVQVAPEDCTGCSLCANACPTKPIVSLKMETQKPLLANEKENWLYFLSLPESDPKLIKQETMLGSQLKKPLFEFSGACAGCGETPYVKLVSQLYGDRLLIANASGCSSVYGGYMPTVPYTTRADGRGPAWSNSLFEDNAEFGLGMRLSTDKLMKSAKDILSRSKDFGDLAKKLINNPQKNSTEIEEQRANVKKLKEILKQRNDTESQRLFALADYLVYKSIWSIGGDGWAYDIGYGGLDHVLASGENINVLVLDTEVYSNTGGQSSKATPLGATAKFASGGKALFKKPLALMQSRYGYVYVAQINLGANFQQTIAAIAEAESYPGPSLVIAYSHCINHGIDMSCGFDLAKEATEAGMWPLFRYNPLKKAEGKNPFTLESKEPNLTKLEDYLYSQVRFKALKNMSKEKAALYFEQLKKDINNQYQDLSYLASRTE